MPTTLRQTFEVDVETLTTLPRDLLRPKSSTHHQVGVQLCLQRLHRSFKYVLALTDPTFLYQITPNLPALKLISTSHSNGPPPMDDPLPKSNDPATTRPNLRLLLRNSLRNPRHRTRNRSRAPKPRPLHNNRNKLRRHHLLPTNLPHPSHHAPSTYVAQEL